MQTREDNLHQLQKKSKIQISSVNLSFFYQLRKYGNPTEINVNSLQRQMST